MLPPDGGENGLRTKKISCGPIIGLTVERHGESGEKRTIPVCGIRRIDWLEAALQPVRSQLTPREFRAFNFSSLTLHRGRGPYRLRDVRGLDVDGAAEVSIWNRPRTLAGSPGRIHKELCQS